MLNCSLLTTFLAIFANFGQIWMIVYTVIIENFEFFKLYRIGIGVTYIEVRDRSYFFKKKNIQQKIMGGGGVSSPPRPPSPQRGIGLNYAFI